MENENGSPENSKSDGFTKFIVVFCLFVLLFNICISTGKSITSNLKNMVLEKRTMKGKRLKLTVCGCAYKDEQK